MSNKTMVGLNISIALVLAILGLGKLGPAGLLCGVPNLIVAIYFWRTENE